MHLAAILTIGFLIIGYEAAAQAQEREWDPARVAATRSALEDLLAAYDAASRSQAYSETLRERARFEASRIRARLTRGDFQVGDRVILVVRGESELSDTFVVAPGQQLQLPLVGNVPLRGVLRSELEQRVTEVVGQSIRDPEVLARSLIRISVSGEIAQPGFYQVPADLPLADAFMLLGGPTREAQLEAARIERGGEIIWMGGPLSEAIREGRTLVDLNMQTGDEVVVPGKGGINLGAIASFAAFTLPTLIFSLTQIF